VQSQQPRPRRAARRIRLTAAIFLLAALQAIGEPTARNARALQSLQASSDRPLVVRRRSSTALPFHIQGRVPIARFSSAASAADRGRDFWLSYGAVFGIIEPETELALRSSVKDGLGMTHLRYDQRYRGLPVFGRQLILHMDATYVRTANGDFAPGIHVATVPGLPAGAASEAAIRYLAARGPRSNRTPTELLVYVDPSGSAHLSWLVTVATERPFGIWRVFVDAHAGEILFSWDDLKTARNRLTHTGGNDPDCNLQGDPLCTLPGALVRTETGPASADASVNAAHVNAGIVYDYYKSTFGRDSYDDAGHTLRATVHHGVGYNNAFWCNDACAAFYGNVFDGEEMVYGDGDGVVFSSLPLGLDVVAHELTHAVTETTAGLVYFGQSGALNESCSDVFATMVDTDDWLLGEDVYTPGVDGDALRSLADPPLFGQPGNMSAFMHTIYDNQGVHGNSGIPNHAAYLAATDPDYGIGRPALEQIYYRALTLYLPPASDFLTNLNSLVQAAEDLYGEGSAAAEAIRRSQAAVGIANPPVVTFPNGGEVLSRGVATTILWQSGAGGGLPFRVQELRGSSFADYEQDFEASSFPPEFATGGNEGWFPDTFEPGDGLRSAGSGIIGNRQRSELSLVVTTVAQGDITFLARVSTEANNDFFSFWVDGERRLTASGDLPWGAVPPVTLSPGTHRLVWVYEKNQAISSGDDAAWIDDLVIPNVDNATVTNINPSTEPGAGSQDWTPSVSADDYRVRVEQLGIAPWLAIDGSDSLFSVEEPPDLSVVISDSPDPVSAGEDVTYTLDVTNAGPVSATNVTLTHKLPLSTNLVSVTANDWTCGAAFGKVTCTLPSLPAGDAPSVSVVARAPGSPATLTTTASVSADEGDAAPDDNSMTISTDVTGSLPGAAFFTVTPCRVVDTRGAPGDLGGPALAAGAERFFTLAGHCGIPETARSVSLNVTATGATMGGHLRLYPGGGSLPLVSSINYALGQTRANNAVGLLGPGGVLSVYCGQPTGTVHVILDVNGYFE